MPLYEFKCASCQALFERLVPVHVSSHECPICGKSCNRVISQIAPPIVKDSSPYSSDITYSQKELDRRVGETVDKKIRPIFEQRQKEKEKYRESTKEKRLRRLPSGNPGEMEYVPADDRVVSKRKTMLGEYREALSEHRKKREAQGLSQFDDSK